ncbi:MAG: dodecin domain-containing protein [Chloroflexi bacterium]|nr:MAG: dodecin domain-containing protein [Chloroflexota bacterium]
MAESVYTVIALMGTSNESWEKAAVVAIEQASKTLRDIRVARIVEQDVHIEPGKPLSYRVKMELSFKYEASA